MKKLVRFVLMTLFLVLQIPVSQAALPALVCQDRHATPTGQDNLYYDGFYIGADGCLYDPASVDLKDVPALQPSSRAPDGHLWWVVNGAATTPAQASLQMQYIAETIHAPVIGIFNASPDAGRFRDQLGEGFIKRHTRPIRTLTTQLRLALDQQQAVYVRGDSQGAVIISAALQQAKAALSAGPLRTTRAAERQLRRISVETDGGITSFYPDGPRYVHFVNVLDPIQPLGVLDPLSHPGAGAVIVLFEAVVEPLEAQYKQLDDRGIYLLSRHGLSAYLSRWVDYETAYSFSNPLGPARRITYRQIQRRCADPGSSSRCGT